MTKVDVVRTHRYTQQYKGEESEVELLMDYMVDGSCRNSDRKTPVELAATDSSQNYNTEKGSVHSLSAVSVLHSEEFGTNLSAQNIRPLPGLYQIPGVPALLVTLEHLQNRFTCFVNYFFTVLSYDIAIVIDF